MRTQLTYEFAARSLMPDLWAMGLFAGEGNIDVRTYWDSSDACQGDQPRP